MQISLLPFQIIYFYLFWDTVCDKDSTTQPESLEFVDPWSFVGIQVHFILALPKVHVFIKISLSQYS